jgi:flagellar basal body-associated protein FliL
MKKTIQSIFTITVLMLTFFQLGFINEAKAEGSCLNPVYLVNHLAECRAEFNECFEDIDGAYDAWKHRDEIIECMVDVMKEEAEELAEGVAEAVGNTEEKKENLVNKLVEMITNITQREGKAANKIRDLAENISDRIHNLASKHNKATLTAVLEIMKLKRELKDKIIELHKKGVIKNKVVLQFVLDRVDDFHDEALANAASTQS